MTEKTIGVAEAVRALRAELVAAVHDGVNEWMRFKLEPIELELQAVVTKDVSGKIGWKILEAGGSYERVATQTVRLTLTPLWRTETGEVTTNFTISGELDDDVQIGKKENE